LCRSLQCSYLKTLGLGFGSVLYLCARFEVHIKASEYVFAVAMTVLIVWLVAEVSVVGALKGPRSNQPAWKEPPRYR